MTEAEHFAAWESELEDSQRLAWLAIELAIAGFDEREDS